MRPVIQDLKETFKEGYEAYESSRREANDIRDLYHNRHFTDEQLNVLAARGQPAETFNIVRMFTRMMVGYYSTVVNTVVCEATEHRYVPQAAAINSLIDKIFEQNKFDAEGDKIKLEGMLSGMLTCFMDVRDTGRRDSFGRPINQVVAHHVCDDELVFDPSSTKDDYSDARYLHRFKWLPEDTVAKVFGKQWLEKLEADYNHLEVEESELEFSYSEPYAGRYKVGDNFLLVHTVMEDIDGKRWSVIWSGEHILDKQEIPYRDVRWNYRVQRLHTSNKKEYYGVFRDIKESQHAINQAVLKIQLMLNSEKAFVEEGAVDDIDEFTNVFNRVNAVIPVKSLSGIRLERLDAEVRDQYMVIDQALARVQRVLGINESFMGMAFASDSGRKVKLQQNATIMSMRYLTQRIATFYENLGWDIAHLVKQYYTAHQTFRVMDEIVGSQWIEINKPFMKQDGMPVMLPYLEENGDPKLDARGRVIFGPVAQPHTEIGIADIEIRMEANAYNDEDEKAQLLLESVMSGQIGTVLSEVNPASFLQVAGLILKSTKTRYSPAIAAIVEQAAQGVSQAGAQGPVAGGQRGAQYQQPARGPMSRSQKLPTNTNEGVE